jgi:exopolyphosphatase/pppGpp-phosphohydrolase
MLCLGQMALRGGVLFGRDTMHHARIPANDLRAVREELVRNDMRHRLRMPGLDARRVDLIVAGAILVDTLLQELGAEEITLCDFALREGLVLDFLARKQWHIAQVERYPDIRRRSVMELGERCRWFPAHATQVARLSLSIFDQTRSIHQLGDGARRWLEYAALLHDIGGHISYTNHHKHSYYLIQNGDLRGFEPSEIQAIALIARYHRKSPPRKSHEDFSNLPPAVRRAERRVNGPDQEEVGPPAGRDVARQRPARHQRRDRHRQQPTAGPHVRLPTSQFNTEARRTRRRTEEFFEGSWSPNFQNLS